MGVIRPTLYVGAILVFVRSIIGLNLTLHPTPIIAKLAVAQLPPLKLRLL